MSLQIIFTEAVHHHYVSPPFVLYTLIEEAGRQLYRVERENAASWLLRAYAYPNSNARQAQHVAVLKLLKRHDYPAPRLIRSRHGETISECKTEDAHWYFVITTFIEGEVLEGIGSTTLALMGEALGQFHRFSISLPTEETQSLAGALWRPMEMVPLATQELRAIHSEVPASEQPDYTMIQRAVALLPPFRHLPAALNHGDCVPTNAIMTRNQQIILIDWADAGWGELVLDLAWLLVIAMGGLPDERAPSNTVQIDPARLIAIVDGYCRYRVPTATECDALLDAMRFVPAFSCALEFCAACRHESSPLIWQGWWQRYQAVPLAAALAKERITSYRG